MKPSTLTVSGSVCRHRSRETFGSAGRLAEKKKRVGPSACGWGPRDPAIVVYVELSEKLAPSRVACKKFADRK